MTTSDLERRVAELEAIAEQRTGTADTDGETNRLSRRSLLHGIGLLGLGGYMTGSASADPQGQLGTADRPVRTVYAQRLAGGLTGETPVTSLLGTGLSIDGEQLRADVADATTTGNGAALYAGLDGKTLQFRSLVAGSNVSLSTANGELTVDAEASGGSGEDNTASNVGTGTGVFKQKSGTDLEFKSLVAGANVSLSSGTDTVTVDAVSDTSPWEDPDADDLLEPVSPYLGIDLSGVTGGQVVTPQVVSPWVGTTDATAFELFAGGTRALRLDPDGNSDEVTVVFGHPNNTASAFAATISGGGLDANGNPNVVYDTGGTVGGGKGNQAGSNDGDATTGREATVAGGLVNAASGGKSAVGGGYQNTASADFATIAGGERHTADGQKTFVGGGQGNTNSGYVGVIGGGISNTVSADRSTVAGGENNDVTGKHAFVGGGLYNLVTANFTTIAGGGPSDTANPGTTNNVVYDDYGAISGGGGNQAGTDDGTVNAVYAAIGGGLSNAATTRGATVAGGEENTAKGADQSTVGGGYQNTADAFRATVAGGLANAATDREATVAGGKENSATLGWSTVGGGYRNEARASFATIAGGGPSDTANPSTTNNAVYDNYGTIGGGGNNQAGTNDGTDNDVYATVGGGYGNLASGQDSTVAGGSDNDATGNRAFVGGGNLNVASSAYSVVPGGELNTAGGTHSFAAGRRAKANDAGSFVWADSQNADFASDATVNGSGVTGTDTFHVRAQSGTRFVNSAGTTYIPSNSTGWTTTSTKTAKTNFEPVDTRDVLDGVQSLDITTWEYRTEDGEGAGAEHMGPMAEQFHEHFELGDSDRHINSINVDGVALAAIQGVADRVDKLRATLSEVDESSDDLDAKQAAREDRIEELETELEAKDERIDRLEERLEDVERALGGGV